MPLAPTDGMIALMLPLEVARQLYEQVQPTLSAAGAQDITPPEDYHITLVYLGESDQEKDELFVEAFLYLGDEDVARNALSGQVNGAGRFMTSEDGLEPVYASFDAVSLPAFRQQIMRLANSVGLGLDQNHGFIPHITLGYLPSDVPTPDLRVPPLDLTFYNLTLARGEDRKTLDLDGDAYAEPMTQGMSIVKQANGRYRWTSISSGNIKDRDGEIVSLKALQADVARTKMFGDEESCLYFYHIPYSIGAAPDYRVIVDGMLIESGEFADEPVAKACAEYFVDHPGGLDGSGWGTSIGFMGVPDATNTYQSVLIHERSVLPHSVASFAYSTFGVKNKMALTEQQQKALDMVLGDPALITIVQTSVSAKAKSKQADADGVVRKMAGGKKAEQPEVPVFKGPGTYEAKPNPQQMMGFVPDASQAQTKDAAAIADAMAAEAAAVASAREADDAASLAMNHTDAVIQASFAENAVAAAAPAVEPEAPVVEAQVAAPAEVKEADPAAAAQADKPKEDAPAEGAKPSTLSEEDMQGIAKFVQEEVAKAIQQMKSEMSAGMQQMQKTFSEQTQVKMMNEVPRNMYEVLKAFSTKGAPGVKEAEAGFVQKGQNQPKEEESLPAAFGFQ
jgi:2'-5' RNA ligase